MVARADLCNFSAGPGKMPQEVLEQAAHDLLSWNGSGMSVMEMSHRSSNFSKIIEEATQDLKGLLQVPDNYHILFYQGGATLQFAAIPMNLSRHHDSCVADYIVTGYWSKKAAEEAKKYCKVNLVLPPTTKYKNIPPVSDWKLSPNASFVYYCANETVDGVEFPFVPDTKEIPLVCDMSSNILSTCIDVSRFGVIIAGAQKNIGPAGLTVVIVRDDLIGKALEMTPLMMDYQVMVANKSLYNTPPTFAIYMAGLVFQWAKKLGGLKYLQDQNQKKSSLLYETIDSSNGFYTCPVEKKFRSRMNVPFRVKSNEQLEKKFLDEALQLGFVELKGHRSVGGLRASLYNAMTLKEVQRFVDFMLLFQKKQDA
eukprot:Sdes_comp20630_c0_seq1m15776